MNKLDLLVVGVGLLVCISMASLLIWIDWHDQD